LLSCDRIKEFFENFFLEWIEEFPWFMLWMMALINEFDNIYMNFLTSPKSSYSPEVVFTLCDVRKVDSNRIQHEKWQQFLYSITAEIFYNYFFFLILISVYFYFWIGSKKLGLLTFTYIISYSISFSIQDINFSLFSN